MYDIVNERVTIDKSTLTVKDVNDKLDMLAKAPR